jgi:hypothetical protein
MTFFAKGICELGQNGDGRWKNWRLRNPRTLLPAPSSAIVSLPYDLGLNNAIARGPIRRDIMPRNLIRGGPMRREMLSAPSSPISWSLARALSRGISFSASSPRIVLSQPRHCWWPSPPRYPGCSLPLPSNLFACGAIRDYSAPMRTGANSLT